MSKPIMFYYQAIIERKMLVEEYNKFTDLLNSSMRDSSYVYDENEKIVYLFKQILGESGEALSDPSLESEPISFYERIKRIINKNEKYVEDRIRAGVEERIYAKDKKNFLDQVYNDCINLINKYPNSNSRIDLKGFPFIIESLERLKIMIEEVYKLMKLDLPKKIQANNVFKRKRYSHKDISQDELIEVVKRFMEIKRYLHSNGAPKYTKIAKEILSNSSVENCNKMSDRGFETRVKDAIKEINFYEVKSTS